MNVFSHYQPWF